MQAEVYSPDLREPNGRARAASKGRLPLRLPRLTSLMICTAGLGLSLAGCLNQEAAESLLERMAPGILGPLAVTSATPDRGAAKGGTEVTIRGTNFEPGVGVLFGDQAASSVEFVNEGLVRAEEVETTISLLARANIRP